MVDWNRMVEMYDEIEAKAATRRSRASGSSGPSSAMRSRSYQQWVQYAMKQMDDPVHNEVMYRIARINMLGSAEHAANVFLRLYGRQIHPFVVPFHPGEHAAEVWDDCIRRIQDYQMQAREWVLSEKEELVDRYDMVYEDTRDAEGTQIQCPSTLSRTQYKALLAAWDENAELFERCPEPHPNDGNGKTWVQTDCNIDSVHTVRSTDCRQDVIPL